MKCHEKMSYHKKINPDERALETRGFKAASQAGFMAIHKVSALFEVPQASFLADVLWVAEA